MHERERDLAADGSHHGEKPQPKDFLLKPGDTIKLTDIAQLVEFEDIIARNVNPDLNAPLWAARTHIRELIRPEGFNGTIANIDLVVLANAYERLLDAPNRGWKGQAGKATSIGNTHKLTTETARKLIPEYRGFSLTAQPRSSRPGDLGQIQAELWYFPIVHSERFVDEEGIDGVTHKVTKVDRHLRGKFGNAIGRVVTQPKFAEKEIMGHRTDSQTIGLSLSFK